MTETEGWLLLACGLLGWAVIELARALDDQAEDIELLAEDPALYRAKHDIKGRRHRREVESTS